MEITQQGIERANSVAFAEEVRGFVQEWRASGMPEEQGRKILIARIALELAGRMDSPPNQKEMKRFLADYAIEINQFAARLMGTLAAVDTQGSAVN